MRNRQRIAFLDTNVLHYLSLYFERVPDDRRYPTLDIAERNETGGGRQRIEESLFERAADYIASNKEGGDAELWEHVGKGLQAVKFLRGVRDRAPYQVEYAPVSELELIEGKVFGAAVQKYAREGAPYRMWSRRPRDEEVAVRVGPGQREDIYREVESLGKTLEEMGVRVADSRSETARDVMDLSREVMKFVHLSVCDAIVYASAMVAGADCVVTTDRHLWRVVTTIKGAESGGGDAIYREAVVEIQRMLAGEGAEQVVLPAGRLIKGIKRKRGLQK